MSAGLNWHRDWADHTRGSALPCIRSFSSAQLLRNDSLILLLIRSLTVKALKATKALINAAGGGVER